MNLESRLRRSARRCPRHDRSGAVPLPIEALDRPDLAALIEDGDQLEAAIASFTTFFEENTPGETIGGDVIHVSVDGDQTDVAYTVTVSGSPLIDPQTGTARRIDDGTWVLARQSFYDLVALGGQYTCPAA